MINCVTETVVMIFKIVIALTFLAILTSLFGFALDLLGLGHKIFKLLRRSAVFNIFTGTCSVESTEDTMSLKTYTGVEHCFRQLEQVNCHGYTFSFCS